MAENKFNLPVREKEFDERVIAIDRVARVVAGGRRFRFRALVIIGDRNGRVGMATAKAPDVTSAISKAVGQAKRHLQYVPVTESGSIAYEVNAKFAGAKVLLKPAGPGTGVIAGGAIRQVLEAAGVKDVLSKALGSSSKLNNAAAALKALAQLPAEAAPLTSEQLTKIPDTTKDDKPTKQKTSKKAVTKV